MLQTLGPLLPAGQLDKMLQVTSRDLIPVLTVYLARAETPLALMPHFAADNRL